MLPFQVAVALLTFIAASVLAGWRGSAAIVSYHIVFAMGIVPLILGAMVHFVPVLTRSRSPGAMIAMLPLAALAGGVLLISHFIFPQVAVQGQSIGAAIIVVAVARLGYWAYRSGSKAIGAPHPCLYWYLAAMACLCVALGAILMMYFIPGQHAALRLLHLHLNTQGFVGMTALGTLQVLLPTVTQRPDSRVAARMHSHLKWIVAGTVLIAGAAAWYPAFAWLGLVLLAIPLLGIAKAWLPLYADAVFVRHGAAPLLAAAVCGYVVVLMLGAAHAYHFPSINPVAAFIIAFLMPLVTGAVSYLLPLWLRPGRQTAWHQAARQGFGLGGGLRAVILLAGGVAAGLDYTIGWGLAALTAVSFVAQILYTLIMLRSSPAAE